MPGLAALIGGIVALLAAYELCSALTRALGLH